MSRLKSLLLKSNQRYCYFFTTTVMASIATFISIIEFQNPKYGGHARGSTKKMPLYIYIYTSCIGQLIQMSGFQWSCCAHLVWHLTCPLVTSRLRHLRLEVRGDPAIQGEMRKVWYCCCCFAFKSQNGGNITKLKIAESNYYKSSQATWAVSNLWMISLYCLWPPRSYSEQVLRDYIL